MSLEEVYVKLLDEGSPTIRGTYAEVLGDNLFKLIATDNYDPEDELWEFLPGSIVRCERVVNDNEEIWLAVEEVEI